jgi:hypothetical protein
MSSDYDIEMNSDETLELDTIIQESSIASDPISDVTYYGNNSYTKNILDEFETHTTVFNPPESGEYDINVNGQVLSINVRDTSSIPDSENLRVHYDATDSSSITTSGSTVTEWGDISGNNEDASNTSGSSEPSFVSGGINGNDAIYFNNSNNDYLQVNLSSNIDHPITVYAVMEAQSLASGTNQIFLTNNAINSRVIEHLGNSNGEYSTYYGGNFVDGGNWDTNPVIFTSVADGSNSEVRANGTTQATGNVGNNALSSINLGAGNQFPGNDMDTYAGEIRIYQNNHSSQTINDIESQLAEKWGINI